MSQSAAGGKKPLPDKVPLERIEELHIGLGYRCNVRCVMCFQKDFTLRSDPVIWREKLLPLYPSVKRIVIQGGEPTVMGDARDLIALALEKNPEVKFSLITNGLAFDGGWQRLMVDHGDYVNFSLNAADKETHEKINRHSCWEKVMANLRGVLELRTRLKSPLTVAASFVILPENIGQMSEFIDLGRSLGVDKIRFLFDPGLLDPDTRRVGREVARAAESARRAEPGFTEGLARFYEYYAAKMRVKNDLLGSLPPAECGLCRFPWSNVYVDHFGNVMFCCMINLNLGNLFERDLGAIYNGRRAVHCRNRMLKNDYSRCMPSCMLNPNPDYRFRWATARHYGRLFGTYVRLNPKVAWEKAKRKIKQWL